LATRAGGPAEGFSLYRPYGTGGPPPGNRLGPPTMQSERRPPSRHTLERICRGRHPSADVLGDFAPDRGTTAAASAYPSMRCPMVMHSSATEGRSAPRCQRKWSDQPQPPFRVPRLRPVACAAGGLARTRQKR